MPRISLEIDVGDVELLMLRLDAAPFVMDEEIKAALDESTYALRRDVQDLTPIDTGHLAASISVRTSGLFRELRGEVFTRQPYAPFVEEGHGEILPKRGRFLRFWPKGATRPVFAKRVRPVAGVHMFRRGRDAALPGILERFREAAHKIARRIAK